MHYILIQNLSKNVKYLRLKPEDKGKAKNASAHIRTF
jgi:hypothetical protein